MQKLKDSELRYRRLFEAAQDGILILNAETGMIEDVNPFLIKMLGYSREEFVEKKLWEVGAFRDIESSKDAFEALQENEYIRYDNLPLKTKDGRLIQVEFVSNVYLVGDEKVIQCDIRDISEYKRIITALQKNEKTYHDLINQSPDGYFIIELSGNILTVNKAMCKELEFSEEEFLSMSIWDIIPEEFLGQYRKRLTKILKGESLKEAAEYEVLGKSGKIHYVEVLSAPRYSGRDIIGFQGIARDISSRKRAENALQESEAKFRELVEHLPTVVYMNAVGNANSTLYVSPQIESLLGYTPQEWLADPKLWVQTLHSEDRQRVLAQIAITDKSSKPFNMEYRMNARDGRLVWVHDQIILVNNREGQPQFWQGIMLDITKRKQADGKLLSASEFLQSVQDALSSHITILDHEGTIVQVNAAWRNFGEQNGLTHFDHCIGMNYLEVCDSAFGLYAEEAPLVANAIREVRSNGRNEVCVEYPCHAPGEARWFIARITGFENNGQKWIVVAHENITERKQAEERTQRQLEHLTSLRTIDRIIAANFDLKLSLSEILMHVTIELGVDAADILILNPNSQMLEYAAERGFRTKAARNALIRLGESYAGRAALERQLVQIPNLRDEPDNLLLTTHLTGEDFACYYGIPLITKGQVNGVLEVFHRTALEPGAEWFDFLQALAGQAAIAIENVTLFENLQRSNLDLTLAYDATIEGWSRALDLRDKETEGHTQRVAEMAVKLARAFRLSDAELVQVRWGALLHDIGKMGVPDGILLKPAPLTDEEWAKMKMHPTFAYNMLAPIHYLRLALDIPYCHHEKWDGSGYPRELKGDQIPLVARIFAVVDVWDALSSDRPYRPHWKEEDVLEHIRASSGTHFDPQVVSIFMQLPK